MLPSFAQYLPFLTTLAVDELVAGAGKAVYFKIRIP